MRFVIAPDWLLKLPDNHLLLSKTVVALYGYIDKEGLGRPAHCLIRNGSLPVPDVITARGKVRNLRWSVGHLKNNMKLPSEIKPLSGMTGNATLPGGCTEKPYTAPSDP